MGHTAVFRVLASPMSRAEVTGHVIFPNIKVGQHHGSTNIAESGKFFYMSFHLQTKLFVTSYPEKSEIRV